MSSNIYVIRTVLKIEDKIEIIERHQNGEMRKSISEAFGIAPATVSHIWSNRKKILENYEKKEIESTNRTSRDDIDKALVLWCRSQVKAGISLNEDTLSTQASKFAEELGYTRHVGSKKWIRCFLRRQNNFPLTLTEEEPITENLETKIADLAFKIQQDIRNEYNSDDDYADNNRNLSWVKSVDLSDITAEQISSQLLKLRNKYSEDDIYNAEEIGLFYDLTPDKIQEFKNQKCKEGELSQNRFTIFICTNMSGTDKRKLLIIGNKTLDSFKNTDGNGLEEMNVDYIYHFKSWMTLEIFTTYVRKWDIELHLKDRTIVLFINMGKIVVDIPYLTNIQLVFLPPNSDSALRAGIIRRLKTIYREEVINFLNAKLKNDSINVSFPKAIKMIKNAWSEISIKYIHDCFLKTAIPDALRSDEMDYSLKEWMVKKKLEVFKNIENIEDFITIDDDIATGTLTEVSVENKFFSFDYEKAVISQKSTLTEAFRSVKSSELFFQAEPGCSHNTSSSYFQVSEKPKIAEVHENADSSCHDKDETLTKEKLP